MHCQTWGVRKSLCGNCDHTRRRKPKKKNDGPKGSTRRMTIDINEKAMFGCWCAFCVHYNVLWYSTYDRMVCDLLSSISSYARHYLHMTNNCVLCILYTHTHTAKDLIGNEGWLYHTFNCLCVRA